MDSVGCSVRMIDVGGINTKNVDEIFEIDAQFERFPGQAYHMHLAGILPSDLEHNWSPKALQIFQKRINKLQQVMENVEFDARIVFSLRNNFVVDKIRAVDIRNAIIHLIFEQELVNNGLGVASNECFERVKDMAKLAGVDFRKTVKKRIDDDACKNPDSSKVAIHSTVPLEMQNNVSLTPDNETDNETTKDLIEFSMELACDDDFKEQWLTAPTIDKGQIIITAFYNPDNFYINYESDR